MTALSWLRRFGPCQIETRRVGEWEILEVRGKLVAGAPGRRFVEAVDDVLKAGARRIVIDLSESLLADDTVASAAPEVYHRARAVGADLRFVVPPGRKGGYYHMAGLEMSIPTFGHLGGAIEL